MSDFKAKIIAELDTSKVEQQINQLNGKDVKFGVDTGKTKKDIIGINNALNSTSKNALAFGDTLKKSLNIGAVATIAREGFQLIRTAANNAVDAIKDLDGAIVDLRMATGQNHQDVFKLVSGYNKMAKSLGATTTQVTNAADAWLRQGNSIDDTNTLIHDSMILSKVGQLDSAEATKFLTSAMKGYGASAEEALGIVDRLCAVDLVSATNAGGLAEGMSEVAVTASNAGITMDKLLGYLASVGEVTQESMSTIGTSFKTIFTRMSDIKSGKLKLIDEDGTTEILSDVEQTLANVGIDLRQTVTEYNNYGDVLDNLAAKWDLLSQVQQNALAKAFAGTRQQNRFRVLMENYDNAKKYMEVAANSAGTAKSKFSAYLDSIEAKVNSLQAAFESLVFNSSLTDMYGGILEGSTAVLEFLDNTKLLQGALSGLATAGAIEGIKALISGVHNSAEQMSNFSNALTLLSSGSKVMGDDFQDLLLMTENLSKSQLKVVLSSEALSTEQRIAILTSQGMTTAQAETALSSIGLATAEGVATASTVTLSSAVKGLWATLKAHPFIMIASAVSIGVMAFSSLNDAAAKAAQAAEEQAQKSKEVADNAKDEIKSLTDLIDKYKELASADRTDNSNREAIKEVQDEITQLVGAQADNLDLVNGKLDEELDKLKNISAQRISDNISSYRTAYNDAKAETQSKNAFHEGFWTDNLFGGENYLINYELLPFDEKLKEKVTDIIKNVIQERYGEVWNGYGSLSFNFSKVGASDFQSQLDAVNEILKQLQNLDGYDTSSTLFSKLSKFKDELQKTYDKQTEIGNGLSEMLITDYDNTNREDVNSLDDYIEYRNKIIDKLKNDSSISEMITDGVMNDDSLSKTVDNYLGTLDDFSDYYNEWYDKFGSDTVKGINEIKKKYQQAIKSDTNNVTEPDNSLIDVFSGDVPQISPPNLTDEAKKQVDKFNNWIDGLSDNDKEIVYNLYCDTDTAQYSLEEWQKALEDYKATVDTVNKSEGAFEKLLSQKGTDNTPSFSENIDSYIENINTLKQALSDYQKGDFSNESLISLIKDFPALANQTDNLDTAIIDLMNDLNNDMMTDFDEQFGKLDTTEDIESLKALQSAVLSLNTNNDINRFSVSVEDATSSFDTAISAFDTIKSAINDYNENGYLTISNLKSLLSLDDAYLLALTNEQGALDLTTDKYKELVKAQALQMKAALLQEAIDAANSIDTKAKALEYLDGCQKEAAKSALSLADAKWDEALATAKARDIAQGTGDMYQQVVFAMQDVYSRQCALIDSYVDSAFSVGELSTATDKYKDSLEAEKKALESSKQALEDKKSALEDTKNGYEDALNSVKDLIDWTEKYIKQTKEDEISSLEDKKQSIDDLIESQKELLQAEKDEYNWNKEIAEKQNAVAADALSASIASLDDSSAGKKAYKEANDALIESRSDMYDTLYEHEIDVRIDALEQMKEKSDEYYDSQIQSINNFLNDEVALYRAACSMIDNDNGTLYGNLLNYARIYTTTTEAEFNHMWYSAQTAMQNYNIANLDTFSLLNNLQSRIYEVDGAIDTISESIASYESKISGVQSKLDDLSNSAQNAVSQIALAMDSENKWREEHKAKWYYNWQGTKYESSKTDRNSAIQDILSQIEHQFGGRFPASAASIYGTIKHYAKGTKSAKGGISKVGENGAEYRILNQGDGIVTAKATENLEKIGSNPDDFVRDVILPKVQDELYIVTNSPGGYLSSDYIKSFPVQHSIPSASDVEELTNEVIKNLSSQNINNESTISPVTNINIQGDATQSTVRALQNEADKIVKRATENVMNIALRNKNII